MDLGLSKTQKLLVDSARDFLEKKAIDQAREMEKTEQGYSLEFWQEIAELGWLGIMFPEEYGGVEGDFLEFILLLERMGSALVPGPFIPTMISGYSILLHGSDSQKKEILTKLTEGTLILSHAFIEPGPDLTNKKIEEKVVPHNGGYLLSGTRLFVPFAHVADWLIYEADTKKGKTLFLINSNKNPDMHETPLLSIGSDKLCEVVLEEAQVSENNILRAIGKGEEILRNLRDWGALAHSAFIAGMLERVLSMTIKHAKQREQFGKPIGSFQAIQHQCADMATEVDQVKLLTYQAAWKMSKQMPATKEIAMAKARASDASRNVGLCGIKIHGGIGITEEYDLQLYFRRLKASELAFGDGDFHREIIAQKLGL